MICPVVPLRTIKPMVASADRHAASGTPHRVAFASAQQWVARLAAAKRAGRLDEELEKIGRLLSAYAESCRSLYGETCRSG
jgi:hypothetical protein